VPAVDPQIERVEDGPTLVMAVFGYGLRAIGGHGCRRYD